MLTAGAARIREAERAAVASGIPEYLLMRRAGEAAAAWIAAAFPRAPRFVVLCGGGNNGGDALVAAAKLARVRETVVYGTVGREDFSGAAAEAARDLPDDLPFEVRTGLGAGDFRPGDVIVDGLLGIGFRGTSLRESVRSFIAAANATEMPIVALDLPSGIDADGGHAAENGAVRAFATVTFGAPKPGLFRNDGALCRGILRVIDIGLALPDAGMDVFTDRDARRLIPRFPVDTHKNRRGRVLVWGSSPEYTGAAALCTAGALKGGAGMVRTVSEADIRALLPAAAIFRKLDPGAAPEDLFPLSDVLVCGCGWGGNASPAGLATALFFPGKVVLDADALNLLARHPECLREREGLILTPHPGEAARLAEAFGLCCGDREETASALAERLGAVVLLKGHDTVAAAPGRQPVTVAAGTPLLASAGSGDVLAGVIGALAAQGLDPMDAAMLGAFVHGAAAELPGRILTADDLPDLIAGIVFQLQHNGLI